MKDAAAEALKPEAVIRALEEYVDFGYSDYAAEIDSDPQGSSASQE